MPQTQHDSTSGSQAHASLHGPCCLLQRVHTQHAETAENQSSSHKTCQLEKKLEREKPTKAAVRVCVLDRSSKNTTAAYGVAVLCGGGGNAEASSSETLAQDSETWKHPDCSVIFLRRHDMNLPSESKLTSERCSWALANQEMPRPLGAAGTGPAAASASSGTPGCFLTEGCSGAVQVSLKSAIIFLDHMTK